MDTKSTGLLLPVTCLPTPFGVGDFGQSAYQWIDRLEDAHLSYWQILPLNPLSYGNSPYQPYSSFAGDELYISPLTLCEEGLLLESECQSFQAGSNHVDYTEVRKYKDALLQKAFSRFKKDEAYQQFIQSQSWLEGYALFRTFKNHNHNLPWVEWEQEYKEFVSKPSFALTPFYKEMEYHYFLQYIFYKQWTKLKSYANKKGITIIGDMPIYVGLDSSDVWQNQEQFLLEEDGTPSVVAGVPPDYFSKFGQRWGNPIYDWEYMQKDHFSFWVNRIHYACRLYDIVRIDHFRAFDTYWEIPESEPTAIIGQWQNAPGYEMFDTLFEQYKEIHILAEDLGDLTNEVYELRDHYHFLGMYVFEFHHHDQFDFNKVVVYSGTHDNETLKGWYNDLKVTEKKEVDDLLDDYEEEETYQRIIHYCLDLPSPCVIFPVWDIMGCDFDCRFNVPGTIGSPNWEWKLESFEQLDTYLEVFKNIMKNSKRGDR